MEPASGSSLVSVSLTHLMSAVPPRLQVLQTLALSPLLPVGTSIFLNGVSNVLVIGDRFVHFCQLVLSSLPSGTQCTGESNVSAV
jgi:hypothetical protein